jgi:endonuclease YncB( thermonuclease family)
VLTLSSLSLTQAAAAEVLSGPARIVDGDTLDIGNVRVRLEGIDAPETNQTCGRKWFGSFECGQAATRLLLDLTKDREVICDGRGRDKYGRTLGVCFAGGLELNAEMVRRGMAWAFVKYSRTYVEIEAEARALRIGIFEGSSEPAWVYRQRQWAGAEQAAPQAGCIIKGNVSRNGHIYHLPWSPWYDRVRVDEARGERWFCSEGEAIAAGWRPAGAAHQ